MTEGVFFSDHMHQSPSYPSLSCSRSTFPICLLTNYFIVESSTLPLLKSGSYLFSQWSKEDQKSEQGMRRAECVRGGIDHPIPSIWLRSCFVSPASPYSSERGMSNGIYCDSGPVRVTLFQALQVPPVQSSVPPSLLFTWEWKHTSSQTNTISTTHHHCTGLVSLFSAIGAEHKQITLPLSSFPPLFFGSFSYFPLSLSPSPSLSLYF